MIIKGLFSCSWQNIKDGETTLTKHLTAAMTPLLRESSLHLSHKRLSNIKSFGLKIRGRGLQRAREVSGFLRGQES